MDHAKASRIGVDWLDEIDVSEEAAAGLVSIGSLNRLTPLRGTVNLMVQKGAAELLASPNLVTDSGTTASFHAGGQIPYVTTSSLGSTHVEFKPYGVELKIQPKVLRTGKIEMKVHASISAPDQTNGVVLSGNTVPALLERDVTTHVTVLPGTTMTLAGLVQTVKEQTTRGVPILRKIPLLGMLFRWRRKDLRRTTIIMFVTPKLVEL